MIPSPTLPTRGEGKAAGGDLKALAYLDWRLLVNRVRAIARDPKRLIPWLIFLAWFGLQVPLRLAIGSSRRTPRLPGVLLAGAASLAPGVYLVIAGLVLRAACRRAPAPFSSPADARFLIGSAIPPRLVMLWLQLRALRGQAWRWSAAVVIYFVALPTLTPNLGQAATTMVALALAASFLLGLRLPLFLVARRNPRLPLVYLTDLVTLAGVMSLAAAVARLLNYEVPRLDLPPGSVLVAAIGGDLAALALLFALALGAGALSIALSGDTYPELWETSVRSFTLRRWLRSGEMPSRGDLRRARQDAGLQTRARTTVASDRGTHVPPGAWTQLWKEWLGLRRGLPGGDVTLLLIVGACIAAGLVLGLLARQGPRGLSVGLGGVLGSLLLTFNLVGSYRIGPDLRNPLWWLSAADLQARLLVVNLAGTLKQFLPVTLIIFFAALAAAQPLVFVIGAPLAFAVVWDLRAIGLATYSLFPNPADIRGPGGVLRFMVFYALAIPIFASTLVVGGITRSFVVGGVMGVTVALAEGILLVLFAAWRIGSNGLAFARAERQ